MKNFLFIIAFLIVLTTVIVGINPQLHKTVVIGNSEFKVSELKNTTSQKDLKFSNLENTSSSKDLKVNDKNIITNNNSTNIKQVDSVKNIDNINTKNTDIDKKFEQLLLVQQQEEDAKRLAEERAKKLAQQKAQQEAKKKADAEAKRLADEQAKKLAQQKAQQEAKKKSEEQRKLIEYQENILWNQWRANICNNVTSRLDKQFAYVAPAGTIYTYSFDVDNQKRISNVVVKISRGYVNATTQQGIFMIQRAIQSLNSSTLLTFPAGTKRTSVKVSSGIERTASQSTSVNANSFNDVETITKQRYQ